MNENIIINMVLSKLDFYILDCSHYLISSYNIKVYGNHELKNKF